MAPDLEAVAEQVFVALADPTRRAILAALATDGPATVTELAEGAAQHTRLKQAVNDFRKSGYGGPCPPPGGGPHHYHFRLLALATERLRVDANAPCRDVEREARGHLLAEAVLVGWYER